MGYRCGYAKIKGTKDSKTTVGLIAHMDTALEFPGQVLNPNIINNYQGEDIVLKNGVNLNTKDFPQLKNCINHTLVTTDGTTLLGADDKAGIAAIMTGGMESFGPPVGARRGVQAVCCYQYKY